MILGRSKAAVARDHVRLVNPWTEIAAVQADLRDLPPGMVAGLDAAVVAVDSLGARLIASRLLLTGRISHVDAAVLAEHWHARATVSAAVPDGACQVDGWSTAQLARAGEDVGVPCAAVETGEGFPSTLAMGHAAAALAAHELLAITGVIGDRPRIGEELRFDLRHGRFDAFRLPVATACAADHVLAAGRVERLDPSCLQESLGELMTACGAEADSSVVLATRAVVALALCEACGASTGPYLLPDALEPCPACGARLAALRRVRRLRWGEAAPAVARRAASAWLRPGDAFALVPAADAGRPTLFAVPSAPLPWEPGAPWDEAAARERFARLPRSFDLARIRSCRIGVLGAGHLGAALIEQIAPLPWKGILIVDRDVVEPCNIPSHPLAARREEAAG